MEVAIIFPLFILLAIGIRLFAGSFDSDRIAHESTTTGRAGGMSWVTLKGSLFLSRLE